MPGRWARRCEDCDREVRARFRVVDDAYLCEGCSAARQQAGRVKTVTDDGWPTPVRYYGDRDGDEDD